MSACPRAHSNGDGKVSREDIDFWWDKMFDKVLSLAQAVEETMVEIAEHFVDKTMQRVWPAVCKHARTCPGADDEDAEEDAEEKVTEMTRRASETTTTTAPSDDLKGFDIRGFIAETDPKAIEALLDYHNTGSTNKYIKDKEIMAVIKACAKTQLKLKGVAAAVNAELSWEGSADKGAGSSDPNDLTMAQIKAMLPSGAGAEQAGVELLRVILDSFTQMSLFGFMA